VLCQFVAGRLDKRWSPEQISRVLRTEFPGEPGRHLVHETIYQAIYRPELGGLRREVPGPLRTGRRRKPHRRCDARRNFRVRALVLRRALRLGPGRSRTLAQLGYPRSRWPRIVMRDTAVNQAVCAGARVALRYAATARRAR